MLYSFSDLYDAIEVCDSELVFKIVSQEPALLNEKDEYGFTVIHAIASSDDEEITKFIIEKGLDINVKNNDGITALHIVLYPEIAQLLIDNGADVNSTDIQGNTPLHIHASDGEETYDVIQVLIDNGADKMIRNKANERPYDIAKSREDFDNMEILK